jgi:EAL domain-containing protein (putative c-di-GMP-specific phosphodiesterase class I)
MAISRTTAGVAAAPRAGLRARAGGLALPATGQRALASAGLRPRPWVARLRRALRREAFVLHYQPIVAVAGGAVSHHEALVRLADEPEGSLIAPAAFLPSAERHGLVRDIDRLVIERVAALLGAGGDRESDRADGTGQELGERAVGGERSIRRAALNLSALSVTDPATLAHIERALERHAVTPSRLVVEITETAAICDMARAQEFCERLLALGCAVALDDFGVGFGSLAYAKRLPCTYLKIDGDFVRELTHSHEDRVIVRAIVELARGLGRETIAECVGDEATLALLGELGVDYAQGFHIGVPVAAS